MPPVIVGVAVAVGVAALTTVTVMTAIAIGLAAAALYSVATMKMPTGAGTDPQSAKQMIRSANSPYRGIYGTVMTSGPITFAEEYKTPATRTETYKVCNSVPGQGRVCNSYTRTINAGETWMHLVLVVAGHPVDSIPKVYFDDEEKTDWDHEYWKISVMDGTQTSINQLPKALLDVPAWTVKMVGTGLAWVHVMLKYSAEHFPNGIPNIKCLVNGKHVNTPFATGFHNNAAAVIYDYLKYHFKATDKMINVDSFRNEFDICKEPMLYEHNPAWGVTPIRYSIDGGFDYDETHENVLNKMLTACGGDLIFTNGQYHLQVAAYRGPVGSKQIINLGDLNGPIDISPDTNLGDRINVVKGTYLDPTQAYQVVDFPEVSNPAYVTADGERKEQDINYEYVLNIHQAHRLANITLKDNRFGLTIQVPMNWRGLKFNAGLPVGFNDASLGYDKLEFRVVSWKVKAGQGVTLTIKQTDPSIYDDSVATVKPKPTEPNLPDPSFVAPIDNLVLVPLPDDNVYDGLLTWSHPDLLEVREFEVVYTAQGGDTTKVTTKDTMVRLQNMQGVEYTIVVLAYNEFGSQSQPVTLTANVGAPKAVTSVVFRPDNFSIVINPVVSGALPINTEFLFYRSELTTQAPSFDKSEYIGSGRTFVDTGRKPNTWYVYFIQVANDAAITDAFGPYSAKTTDDPKDIIDVIGPSIPGQYTWVVYASDAFGSNISKDYNPNIHKYEGRSYNHNDPDPSLNPLDYFFVRIGDFVDPADQSILDNLANGKTPDGKEDLVREDDILFKPGDKVQETNIADDSISTPKIKANAILADNIAANAITAPKISAGAVTASKIAANAVTAAKILAGAVTAEKLEAGAVTAEKIAVTVVEPINNWSQWDNLRGWSMPSGTIVTEIDLNGRKARTLKLVHSSTGDIDATSDSFTIDHNSIYEFRLSIYSAQATDVSEQEWGMEAFGSDGSAVISKTHHPETLAPQYDSTAPFFWKGYVKNGWRHMVVYVIGAAASIEQAPKAVNVTNIIKLGADATTMNIRVSANQAMGTINESHYYSPSGVKLGSGILVADQIKANTLITAPRIVGGTIEGNQITGGKITGTEYDNGNGTYKLDKDGNLVATSTTLTGNITATSGTFKGRIEADSGYFSGEIRGGSGYFTGSIYANKIIGDIVSGKSVYYPEQDYSTTYWTTIATASVKGSSSGRPRVLYCNGVSLSGAATVDASSRVLGFEWRVLVNGAQVAYCKVTMPGSELRANTYSHVGNSVAVGGGSIGAGVGSIAVQVKYFGNVTVIKRNSQNVWFSLITDGSEFN